jgi:hypothetical protein
LRRFLEHVVQQSLAGRDDALKEYSLGVDVFDRGIRFDPREDAIVRVEARRLREKLRRYYRAEGATDLVIISIPIGAYRPAFHQHESPPASVLDDPDALCCQAESLVLRAMGHIAALAGEYEALEAAGLASEVSGSRLAAIHVALGHLQLAARSLARARCDGDWDLAFARGDVRWKKVGAETTRAVSRVSAPARGCSRSP